VPRGIERSHDHDNHRLARVVKSAGPRLARIGGGDARERSLQRMPAPDHCVRSRMISARFRRALFTARESGNTLPTQGSSSTTFVPSRYLAAYLPRTPPRNSYCDFTGRLRGVFLAAMFVVPSLAARGAASPDDPDRITSIRVHHDEQSPRVGHAHRD